MESKFVNIYMLKFILGANDVNVNLIIPNAIKLLNVRLVIKNLKILLNQVTFPVCLFWIKARFLFMRIERKIMRKVNQAPISRELINLEHSAHKLVVEREAYIDRAPNPFDTDRSMSIFVLNCINIIIHMFICMA